MAMSGWASSARSIEKVSWLPRPMIGVRFEVREFAAVKVVSDLVLTLKVRGPARQQRNRIGVNEGHCNQLPALAENDALERTLHRDLTAGDVGDFDHVLRGGSGGHA